MATSIAAQKGALMKAEIAIGVAALALLGGCGDGGSGSSIPVVPGAPTPSPSPSPSPTPSPTPTPSDPTDTPTLLTLTESTSLPGFSGDNGFSRKDSGLIFSVQDYSAAAEQPVFYDAANHSFTYYLTSVFFPAPVQGSFTFTRDAASSTASFSQYTGTAGDTTVRLTQLNIGSSNPTLALYYCSLAYAKATYRNPTTGAIGMGIEPMSFGLQYDWGKQPLHGLAAYRGILLGSARGQGSSHAYDLTGSVEIDLDYDTTDFTGSIHLTAQDDLSGRVIDLGTIPLKASSPRGVLDYLYSRTTQGDQMQSTLAGSRGEELMGVFDAHLADPQAAGVTMKIAAAFVGKRSASPE